MCLIPEIARKGAHGLARLSIWRRSLEGDTAWPLNFVWATTHAVPDGHGIRLKIVGPASIDDRLIKSVLSTGFKFKGHTVFCFESLGNF